MHECKRAYPTLENLVCLLRLAALETLHTDRPVAFDFDDIAGSICGHFSSSRDDHIFEMVVWENASDNGASGKMTQAAPTARFTHRRYMMHPILVVTSVLTAVSPC